MTDDKAEYKTITEIRIYRNRELAKRIEEKFPAEDWPTCWRTVFLIAETYPSVAALLRGELIDVSKQED